jgi:hypothetical protein
MSAVMRPRHALRPMRSADFEQVLAIERTIYTHPWTLGNFRDSLQAGYSCWVMERDGAMVGYGVLMIGVAEAHLLNLSTDDVYSVTAYVLQLNGIVSASDVLDANSLPKIKMPNRDGFVPDARPDAGKKRSASY